MESGGTALGAEAWHHVAYALTPAAASVGTAIADFGGPHYAADDDWAAMVPGIRSIDKCRVRHSGLAVLVEIQIEVGPAITVREGHALAHTVQDRLVGAGLAI